MVGNLLLCFSIEMLFRLALVGASGVMEHPDCPDDEDKPSIPRLAIIAWLLQMGVETFSFGQGLLGAPAPEPTRLVVINLPNAMKDLRSHHLAKDPPRWAAIGRNDTGGWKTTVLKEYPPDRGVSSCEKFCGRASRMSVRRNCSA